MYTTHYPIVIPSRGRYNEVVTIDLMPKEFWGGIILFVPVEEKSKYQHTYGDKVRIESVSDYTHKISEKRELMAKFVKRHLNAEHFWMMDDDLVFAERESEESTSLTKIAHDADAFQRMFDHAYNIVTEWAEPLCAVGISLRQGNNNLDYHGANNTRLIRCGIFNLEAFLSAEHNRLDFMGDFDVMLQMLRMGYDNHVIARFCQDHKATNAKGGCETSRTAEVMNEVAGQLADLHHPFVRTKQKQNKTGPLAVRTDVTIFWKKARASADR